MKVPCTAFLHLQFGFVIFWQKNISAKAARKMLMKWTPGVDFTDTFAWIFPLNKMRSFFGKRCSPNGKLIWQILPYMKGNLQRRRKLVKLKGNFFAKRFAPGGIFAW
jgi:hypothetical protein